MVRVIGRFKIVRSISLAKKLKVVFFRVDENTKLCVEGNYC